MSTIEGCADVQALDMRLTRILSSDEGASEHLRTVIRLGPWEMASNGFTLVVRDASTERPDTPVSEGLKRSLLRYTRVMHEADYQPLPELTWPDRTVCVTCGGSGRGACQECGGEGEVELANDFSRYTVACKSCETVDEGACPACAGSGQGGWSKPVMRIQGRDYNPAIIHLFAHRPGVELAVLPAACGFRWGHYHAMVMMIGRPDELDGIHEQARADIRAEG